MTTFLHPALFGLPQPSNQILLIIAGVLLSLFLLGWLISTRPSVKAKLVAGQDRAFGWIERSIAVWEHDGRLSTGEAVGLRGELREPEFTAVLPYLGAHILISIPLRFPLGSMVRPLMVLGALAVSTLRYVRREIDGEDWRQAWSIHSPLVVVLSALPGVGSFAYLASKPFRAHPLLMRIALDAVLVKLPKRAYDRSGLRKVIARPVGGVLTDMAEADGPQMPRLQLRVLPAQIVAPLAAIAGTLFAADLVMQTADEAIAPTVIGWDQARRILDLGSEASLGTWFALVLLFLSATLLAVIAVAKQRAGDRFSRHWWILALLVFGFSLDEQAKFHDAGGDLGGRMRETLGLSGLLYYGWVIIALASVAIVALLFRHFLIALPARTRTLFIVAGGLYVGGEVLMEMINGWLVDTQGNSLLVNTTTSIEEFCGLVGIIIAFATLLAYVRDHVGEIRLRLVAVPVAESAPTMETDRVKVPRRSRQPAPAN